MSLITCFMEAFQKDIVNNIQRGSKKEDFAHKTLLSMFMGSMCKESLTRRTWWSDGFKTRRETMVPYLSLGNIIRLFMREFIECSKQISMLTQCIYFKRNLNRTEQRIYIKPNRFPELHSNPCKSQFAYSMEKSKIIQTTWEAWISFTWGKRCNDSKARLSHNVSPDDCEIPILSEIFCCERSMNHSHFGHKTQLSAYTLTNANFSFQQEW